MPVCKICGQPVTAGPVYHADCLEKSGGWISVKDRLPGPREEVLAFSPEYKEYMIGRVCWRAEDGVVCEFYEYELHRVTHWAPLSEPPREEG